MSIQTFTGHPLIKNTQEYMVYHKYVSIHSQDRDILKYPSSSAFEIELPQDYLNVLSVRLSSWSFPSNYNTFSNLYRNTEMTFQISEPYNPQANGDIDPLHNAIYEALEKHIGKNFLVILPEGFYNPNQLVITLTAIFNITVSDYLTNYLSVYYPSLLPEFIANNKYQEFVIVYNEVNQKIWFGNRCDVFILTNETQIVSNFIGNINCNVGPKLPSTNYGLPEYLGLPLANLTSISTDNLPNFYYNISTGFDGNWVTPDPALPGSKVSVLPAPDKINILGNAYFYMVSPEFNCMDITAPFNISPYTLHTNNTNGMVDAAFAKISVPVTPLAQWYDSNATAYKLFNPPAERIRKFRFKLVYHDGTLVEFGKFNYSFNLEFTMYVPTQSKKYNLYTPEVK